MALNGANVGKGPCDACPDCRWRRPWLVRVCPGERVQLPTTGVTLAFRSWQQLFDMPTRNHVLVTGGDRRTHIASAVLRVGRQEVVGCLEPRWHSHTSTVCGSRANDCDYVLVAIKNLCTGHVRRTDNRGRWRPAVYGVPVYDDRSLWY